MGAGVVRVLVKQPRLGRGEKETMKIQSNCKRSVSNMAYRYVVGRWRGSY